jgi:group I intron endonuclease
MAEMDSKPYGRVYLVTNSENGKKYIGQTVMTLEQRWSKHQRTKGCSAIHAAINKYGKDAFSIVEIAQAFSANELNEIEKNAVEEHNCISPNGYNLKEGGGSKGRVSEDSREKMRVRMKERWADPEYRAAQVAKKQTPEYKKKLKDCRAVLLADPEWRGAMVARLQSDEHRKIVSESNKAMWLDEAYRAKQIAALNTPEAIAKAVERGKAIWNNLESREKILASTQSKEGREKRSVSLKLVLSNPDVKKKQSDATKRRWEDREAMMAMCQSAEVIAKRKATAAARQKKA